MSITVLYFASLRDAAGCSSEQWPLPESLASLYEQLRARHGFPLSASRLRVAIDGDFADWASPLRDGCEVAFIPPVSGG
ncbi:MoaD/ThiS family protein [Arenimonas sp. MALMAid1274]|uniref:MoaD/ThiS family protein n=1 Tax=Arenimonas sp. MALMAid1274 TaxID=3411630 RepID=UPI003B9EAAD1